MFDFKKTLLLAGIAITVSGCTGAMEYSMDNAQYWQRSSVSSAIYVNGPKAQQMLQRDIANCVTEVRELERLGVLRNAIPGDTKKDGSVHDPRNPRGQIAQYQSPARDAYLYADDFEFHDFETCMIDKGWERVAHLPYDTARTARRDYVESIRQQRYRDKYEASDRTGPTVKQDQTDTEYDRLNK